MQSSVYIHLVTINCAIIKIVNLCAFPLTGRFDFNKPYYQCNSCGKDVVSFSLSTFVQCGYWPGSPNDTSYLFHQDLFILWDALQKRMPGTSEGAFIRGLEDISFLKGRVINQF